MREEGKRFAVIERWTQLVVASRLRGEVSLHYRKGVKSAVKRYSRNGIERKWGEIYAGRSGLLLKTAGAYPLENKSAALVATILFQRWICENRRSSRQVHSDQGSGYVNQVVGEVERWLGSFC